MADVFCKIIKKQLPANVLYENKRIIAFLDNEPFSKGHVLIVPKKHIVNLHNTDSRVLKEIIILAAQLEKILKNTFKFDGIIFVCTSGSKLQDVKHIHFHVYGKNKNQKDFYYKKFKDNESKEKALRETADLIRKKIIAGKSNKED
jgi:histidine triad (HIT) family protein